YINYKRLRLDYNSLNSHDQFPLSAHIGKKNIPDNAFSHISSFVGPM
ncbi:9557_t:CDS:2, partial [Entrophospora sp. SA101]